MCKNEGANPGNPPSKKNPRSEGTPHSRRPRTSTPPFLCGVPSEHTYALGCSSQGDAPSAPLTDGVGSVLDREVYFPLAGYAGPGFHTWPSGHFPHDPDPKRLRGGQAATVAGYAGPGFHNWPSGHIPQATDPKPRPRIRSPTQKTFGETFGEARAATVVSSFASKHRAAPGSATPAREEPWRTRHYPRATDTKRLRR